MTASPRLEDILRDLEAVAVDCDGEKVVQWDETRTRALLGLTPDEPAP